MACFGWFHLRHWWSQVISGAYNFIHCIKKGTAAQVYSCEFYKVFKNIFFTEHLRVTASKITDSLQLMS